MLKTLTRLFRGNRPVAAEPSAASAYWSNWQQTMDEQQPRWVDWGEHPTFLARIYRELFGADETTLFHYLKSSYPSFAQQRALSLCSGDGHFESLLVSHRVFGEVTGIDISDYRVAKAQEEHASVAGLRFAVGDVNSGAYGYDSYDVVFAKAALHHIENLEAAFAGMHSCLHAHGRLVTIDFFGPTRFQWTDAQLELANMLLQQVPETLRRRRDGSIKTDVTRPTVEEMIAADPSEAVRSAEVRRFIDQYFIIEEEHNIGGTVFNLVFTADILDNFDPDEPEHKAVIDFVFQKEREQITLGTLPSDFKFIIASKRAEPRH